MQQQKKTNKAGNILVIALIAAAALGLLIGSQFLSSPNAGKSAEDIEAQRLALATASPTSENAPAPFPSPDAENGDAAPGYLFIILNGRVWGIEPLGEERDVTVDQGEGVKNVIHIQPDGFYMASSTCDNQLCVSEGTVTLTNWQTRLVLGPNIYCLPHGLQLELVVPNQTRDADAPDI